MFQTSHISYGISRIMMTGHQASPMSTQPPLKDQQQFANSSSNSKPRVEIDKMTSDNTGTEFFVLWPERSNTPVSYNTHIKLDGSPREYPLLDVSSLMSTAIPGLTEQTVWEYLILPSLESQAPLSPDTELDSLTIGRDRHTPLVIRRSSEHRPELPRLLRQKPFKYRSKKNKSLKALADCAAKRHLAWKQGKSDRNLHPIPFLADGPGSGKSRFLHELPTAFIKFVEQGPYPARFKSIFKTPLCINITFSNGYTYTENEARSMDIEKSVCLRILYQFETEHSNFWSFYDRYKMEEFSLTTILRNIDASCIILGIDEVNKVLEVAESIIPPGDQKASENQKERVLTRLFGLVGGLSCSITPFFVPVLAGNMIGPIQSAVSKSTHPPLHIPFPLLSFESCLNIFAKKEM